MSVPRLDVTPLQMSAEQENDQDDHQNQAEPSTAVGEGTTKLPPAHAEHKDKDDQQDDHLFHHRAEHAQPQHADQ